MKITFLGDSIRQQYAPRVKELLGDDFEVWYPEENGRFSKYTLRSQSSAVYNKYRKRFGQYSRREQ